MLERIDYTNIGETVYRGVLSNGLPVNVVKKAGYSHSFAMLAVNYGGADRRFKPKDEWIDTPAGVAHFLEHKMFDMPQGGNALFTMAALGAQPNAYTSSGMTAYHFDCVDNFYDNLKQLVSFVTTPYFTAESVAKEQGIIGQEIMMCEDMPEYVVYYSLMRGLYAHHPVRDNVAGSVESIAEITPETLYLCHGSFYRPSNMCLCVAGDVDPQRVEDTAMYVLTDVDGGRPPERDYGEPETVCPAAARQMRKMSVSAPQFAIGIKIKPAPRGEAYMRQNMVGSMAMYCLFNQSSPFFLRLYANGLLNSEFTTDLDYCAGTLTAMWLGESRDPEAVQAEIAAELKKAAEGIAPAEWARAKKSAYGARIRSLSSFSGICTAMVGGCFEGYDYMQSFEVLSSITKEEAERFIAENLTPERMAVSIVREDAEAAENA